MTRPWQDEKWFNANIERLEAIVGGNPWHVRPKLREYIEKLKKVADSNAAGAESAPTN